jgi:four helix bundle protein
MNDKNISIQDRTKQFALRAIKVYSFINDSSHFNSPEAIISKQFLRSSTSVGANCAEAKSAQSTKDFISKYEISLKEAQETKYWLELLIEGNLISEKKLSLIYQEIKEIIAILTTSINKLKTKLS